jgi:hypothetical protein
MLPRVVGDALNIDNVRASTNRLRPNRNDDRTTADRRRLSRET